MRRSKINAGNKTSAGKLVPTAGAMNSKSHGESRLAVEIGRVSKPKQLPSFENRIQQMFLTMRGKTDGATLGLVPNMQRWLGLS
jgi:hypothetical protein